MRKLFVAGVSKVEHAIAPPMAAGLIATFIL